MSQLHEWVGFAVVALHLHHLLTRVLHRCGVPRQGVRPLEAPLVEAAPAQAPGQSPRRAGKFVVVWTRGPGGAWRIHTDGFSGVPPDPESSPDP